LDKKFVCRFGGCFDGINLKNRRRTVKNNNPERWFGVCIFV